ncbi:MAG: glycoside hydrolase family 6 protein [Candidatus Wildermuthbacteria bacterium]|nr:glycoside hydrolase family 6 protein [Candidatus Wildermuthbacteria bacterium]
MLFLAAGVFVVADLMAWHTLFSGISEEQREEEIVQENEEEQPQEGYSLLPILRELPSLLRNSREGEEEIPAPQPTPVAYTCKEILTNSPFFRSDSLQAFMIEVALRAEGKEEIANQLQAISCVPQGIWVNGKNPGWEVERVKELVEKANLQGKIPVFVVYDGPNHEDSGWRFVESGKNYREWILLFGNAVGNARAWIILEPDALPLAFTYSSAEREKRFLELKSAIQTLKQTSPSAKIYLDAGHSQWKPPEVIAEFLQKAGVAQADGFSLNIANHQPVNEQVAYGKAVSQLLGDAHFVIDTGQSGKKVEGQQWCNARGRAIGNLPTLDTRDFLIDAFLWVKPPGESDGTCNGGPPAGKFWLDYALQLIANKS